MFTAGSRRVFKAGVLAGTAALVVGGAAFAAARHTNVKPTTTQQTIALTTSAPKSVKSKTCVGTDGSYTMTTGTYSGTASGSTDKRLNGPVKLKLTTLLNTTTGDGSTSGSVTWNPTSKGKVKHNTASGSLWATDVAAGTALVQPNTLKGFIFAKAHSVPAVKVKGKVTSPAVPAGTLYANFSASGSPSTGWSGTTGSQAAPANDSRAPAVLQTGSC